MRILKYHTASAVTNDAAMSASAIISTTTPDRSGDVVESFGCDLANYKKNPVVYFDHGLSGITIPIAKSETPDGRFTVKVSSDQIEATSYFAQDIKEATQIYSLIEQKVIRSASVNMRPVAYTPLKGGGNHFFDWELLEWSWVGIPDNPQALRKILDGGKLAGSAIAEPIRKSLAPYAAVAKREKKSAPWIPPPNWEQDSRRRQMVGRAYGLVKKHGKAPVTRQLAAGRLELVKTVETFLEGLSRCSEYEQAARGPELKAFAAKAKQLLTDFDVMDEQVASMKG